MKAPTPFLFDAFLSYSSKDKDVAFPLFVRLKNRGLNIWFDQDAIQAGDSIPRAVGEGLDNSRNLIVLVSPNWASSEWARLEEEVMIFRDPSSKRGKIIPVVIGDCEIPPLLRHRLYLDARPKLTAQVLTELIQGLS